MTESHLIIYKLFVSGWNEFGEEVNSLEHFGRIVGYFPPPNPEKRDGRWMNDALQLSRQAWFWGDSSKTEVECMFDLDSFPTGSFIVRFANNHGFRLSIKKEDGQAEHFKIRHAYQGTEYEIRHVPALAGKMCHSLRQCAELAAKHLNVELQDPPFSKYTVQKSCQKE